MAVCAIRLATTATLHFDTVHKTNKDKKDPSERIYPQKAALRGIFRHTPICLGSLAAPSLWVANVEMTGGKIDPVINSWFDRNL